MTILDANQKLLLRTPAASGRMIKEDGTVVNLAELLARAGLFTGSSYTPKLTMGGTAHGGAIPTGATKFKVQNNGTTGQNVAIVFGATQTDANDNLTIVTGAATTGGEFAPIVDGGTPPPENIPSAGIGGFYAIANTIAGHTQKVSLGFGV